MYSRPMEFARARFCDVAILVPIVGATGYFAKSGTPQPSLGSDGWRPILCRPMCRIMLVLVPHTDKTRLLTSYLCGRGLWSCTRLVGTVYSRTKIADRYVYDPLFAQVNTSF